MSGEQWASCGVCREPLFPAVGGGITVANFDIERLAGGRIRWQAKDFGVVFHECPPEFHETVVDPGAVLVHVESGYVWTARMIADAMRGPS